jgi:hypothetical protein
VHFYMHILHFSETTWQSFPQVAGNRQDRLLRGKYSEIV